MFVTAVVSATISVLDQYTTYTNERSWATAHNPDDCIDEDYIYDGSVLSEVVVTS